MNRENYMLVNIDVSSDNSDLCGEDCNFKLTMIDDDSSPMCGLFREVLLYEKENVQRCNECLDNFN